MSTPRSAAAALACTTALLSVLLAAPASAQQADTLTATIGGPNRPPVVQHDRAVSRGGVAVSVDVFANDSDPDGDALELVGGTSAGHGSVSFDGSVATYTPDAGFTGEDSFGYVASDPYGGTSSGVVRVLVTGIDALESEAPQRISTGVEVTAPRVAAPAAAPVPVVQPAARVVPVAAPPQRRVGPSTTPYAAPVARPATLPFTGDASDVLLPLGLGLLLTGALAARAGRRTA